MKVRSLLFGKIDETSTRLAAQFCALSHPARLQILRHLSRDQCCCGEVVEYLDLAQSTVSQHLKILVEAGLVSLTVDRQRSLYRVDRAALDALSRSLSGFVDRTCRGTEIDTGHDYVQPIAEARSGR